VALSLVLLVGSLLFVGSLRKLMAVDPGFRVDALLETDVDFGRAHYPKERNAGMHRELLDRLRTVPGVRAAAEVAIVPISGSGWNNQTWSEAEPGKRQNSFFNRVSPGYFATIGTAILAGRDFDERDRSSGPRVAVVNEVFAKRFFGGGNPVGRNFLVQGGAGEPDDRFQVVGLVRNTKYYEIREDFEPIAYLVNTQERNPDSGASFLMRTSGGAGEARRAIKAAVAEMNPAMDIQFTDMPLQVQNSLARDKLMATLAGAFGLLAAILATIGLYGVISYMVARRRNEIGIRIALGADRMGVVRLVLREAALLLAFGLPVGAGLALWAGRAAGSLLFGLKPSDPASLGGASVLLAAVALAASFGPARRASRLEPMQALRED
jgi:predicted permease